MQVWLVFQFQGDSIAPDFQGVFSTKEKAIAACTMQTYCVCGPELLDHELPTEPGLFPKCWYPLLEPEPYA